jgi:hypothetical protein
MQNLSFVNGILVILPVLYKFRLEFSGMMAVIKKI